MFGLEAISHYNGWVISLLGVSIVFTGLLILSFSVAQLHNILNLWDNRKSLFTKKKEIAKKGIEIVEDFSSLTDTTKEAARQFYTLTQIIMNDEPFSLPRLIDLAEKTGISSPYSTANKLIKANLIIPDQKGYFVFNKGYIQTLEGI